MRLYNKKNNNPLILHLKYKYYNMIVSGSKTIEYREFKPYWQKRIEGKKQVVFKSGYNSYYGSDIHAVIEHIRVVSYGSLPDHAKECFKNSEWVLFYAIYFKIINKS